MPEEKKIEIPPWIRDKFSELEKKAEVKVDALRAGSQEKRKKDIEALISRDFRMSRTELKRMIEDLRRMEHDMQEDTRRKRSAL